MVIDYPLDTMPWLLAHLQLDTGQGLLSKVIQLASRKSHPCPNDVTPA